MFRTLFANKSFHSRNSWICILTKKRYVTCAVYVNVLNEQTLTLDGPFWRLKSSYNNDSNNSNNEIKLRSHWCTDKTLPLINIKMHVETPRKSTIWAATATDQIWNFIFDEVRKLNEKEGVRWQSLIHHTVTRLDFWEIERVRYGGLLFIAFYTVKNMKCQIAKNHAVFSS